MERVAADNVLEQICLEQSSLESDIRVNNGHAQEEICIRRFPRGFLLDLIDLISFSFHQLKSNDEKNR